MSSSSSIWIHDTLSASNNSSSTANEAYPPTSTPPAVSRHHATAVAAGLGPPEAFCTSSDHDNRNHDKKNNEVGSNYSSEGDQDDAFVYTSSTTSTIYRWQQLRSIVLSSYSRSTSTSSTSRQKSTSSIIWMMPEQEQPQQQPSSSSWQISTWRQFVIPWITGLYQTLYFSSSSSFTNIAPQEHIASLKSNNKKKPAEEQQQQQQQQSNQQTDFDDLQALRVLEQLLLGIVHTSSSSSSSSDTPTATTKTTATIDTGINSTTTRTTIDPWDLALTMQFWLHDCFLFPIQGFSLLLRHGLLMLLTDNNDTAIKLMNDNNNKTSTNVDLTNPTTTTTCASNNCSRIVMFLYQFMTDDIWDIILDVVFYRSSTIHANFVPSVTSSITTKATTTTKTTTMSTTIENNGDYLHQPCLIQSSSIDQPQSTTCEDHHVNQEDNINSSDNINNIMNVQKINQIIIMTTKSILECIPHHRNTGMTNTSTTTTTATTTQSPTITIRCHEMSCRIIQQLYQWLKRDYQHHDQKQEQQGQEQTRYNLSQLVMDKIVNMILWGIYSAGRIGVETMHSTTTASTNETVNVEFSTRGQDESIEMISGHIVRPLIQQLVPLLLLNITTSTSNTTTNPVQMESEWMMTLSSNSPKRRNWFSYHSKISMTLAYLVQTYQKSSHVWTIATTFLCLFLPSWVHISTPSLLQISHDDEGSSILSATATSMENQIDPNQIDFPSLDWVWDLIFQCLGCGIYIPKRYTWVNSTKTDRIRSSTSSSKRSSMDDMSPPESHKANNPTARDDHQEGRSSSHSILLRRRGLYLLQLMLSAMEATGTAATTTTSKKPDRTKSRDPSVLYSSTIWHKYLSCYETIEMEHETHLIDQIWPTLSELLSVISQHDGGNMLDSTQDNKASQDNRAIQSRRFGWDWISVLLGRIITSPNSPVLRKLSLYRLLAGYAGIQIPTTCMTAIPSQGVTNSIDPCAVKAENNMVNNHGKRRNPLRSGTSIRILPVDFLFDVIIPSYDSLEQSVGLTMHIPDDTKGSGSAKPKQPLRANMTELMMNFVHFYILSLATSEDSNHNPPGSAQLSHFVRRLWSNDVIGQLHRKTTVKLFEQVAMTLQQQTSKIEIPLQENILTSLVESLDNIFSLGSVPASYQKTLLQSSAIILEHSIWTSPPSPLTILLMLALYPISPFKITIAKDSNVGGIHDKSFAALSIWLTRSGGTPTSAATLGVQLALSFVDGNLESRDNNISDWLETSPHRWAKAIVLFCCLAADDHQPHPMVEPAISKGLLSIGVEADPDKVGRALLLWENDCQFTTVARGNSTMGFQPGAELMPSQPTAEQMLRIAAHFLLGYINLLVTGQRNRSIASVLIRSDGSSRSSSARLLSSKIGKIISLLRILRESHPTSVALAEAAHDALAETAVGLTDTASVKETAVVVRQLCLVNASLACGAVVPWSHLLSICESVVSLHFAVLKGEQGSSVEQPMRSLFQLAKWGVLSLTLRMLIETTACPVHEKVRLADLVVDQAVDSVDATTMEALPALFQAVLCSAQCRIDESHVGTTYLARVAKALLNVVESTKNSISFLDEACKLLFQPSLLHDEFVRYQEEHNSPTPIRDAYRYLMDLAGTQRPLILRCTLSRIAASWLASDSSQSSRVGVAAIPYRDDILHLLLFKEDSISEASSTPESSGTGDAAKSMLAIPEHADSQSVTRAFALVFLARLPPPPMLSSLVLKELIHPALLFLLDKVRPSIAKNLVMIGTKEYCVKIRGWQALCILSRFVTEDIVDDVCEKAFVALSDYLHGQIRYFIEVFTIQCARMFPVVFGRALVEHMSRRDITPQMISSLMVVSGNLIVGRFRNDFVPHFQQGHQGTDGLARIVGSVIPWLSSTQGFSRAIAQLLVHQLIPLVIDVSNLPPDLSSHSNWYLAILYRFLEENPEMQRVRKKQTKFFDMYEVDDVCTPEGVLRIPVDSGGEAQPVHIVEVIKECLQDVYEDVHGRDIPIWKQVEEMAPSDTRTAPALDNSSATESVNFQRKILPLDSLNLALESEKERRTRNIAGRVKQPLVVCATLIDKVPNLGGLARTSEIFAASRLVIPDLTVTKMDNFASLSVGAGDWIEIEECKEHDLLRWLKDRKVEGYWIIGLEQTSSSVVLSDYCFPIDQPVVLLLGKEKEGIPVEYIQIVDQCVEIPQLGIIRSLNVHVSAAIAIWEYTRQGLQNHSM